MDFSDIYTSFSSAILQTTLTEWMAVLTAIIYVVLASKQNKLCWLFGNLSVVLYTIICYENKLYVEIVLQVFYFTLGIFGWINWSKNIHLNIYKLKFKKLIKYLLIPIPFWITMSILFSRYTQASQPILDSLITVYSILATWMTAKNYIENWLIWIVVNALAIFLYFNRALYLSSALYLLYCFIATYGYLGWKKRQQLLCE